MCIARDLAAQIYGTNYMKIPLDLLPAQALLCDALADRPIELRNVAAKRLWENLGDKPAFTLAQANQVTPGIAHALMNALGPDNVSAHWRQAHEETYRRTSAYLAELDRIAELLANVGVTAVLLENGALARAIYPCPGCFDFGDLDLLVPKEHLPIVDQVLSTEDYVARLHGDRSNGRVEYAIRLSSGHALRLNFQWSLVARRWFDTRGEPDVETLMKRSVPIAGSAVRMLCPEDSLYQLAIHNACHAYVRKPGIRLHLDIERFVRRVSLDWAEFAELVERYRVRTPVYFSLAIPKVLFDTPIPDEVFAALHPPVWKERIITHWLQRLDLFSPDERKFSNLGLILFKLLLYDDVWGLWYAIFPDRTWMRQRYGFQSDLLLPAYHARRLIDLTLRRRPQIPGVDS